MVNVSESEDTEMKKKLYERSFHLLSILNTKSIETTTEFIEESNKNQVISIDSYNSALSSSCKIDANLQTNCLLSSFAVSTIMKLLRKN